MTNIHSILQYPATKEAIIEIENYINHTTLTVFDYHTVFMHLLKLKFELSFYSDVLNQGSDYYENKYNVELKKDYEKFFNLVIDAALNLKKYDKAYQYIMLFKEELPVLEKYKALLKLIDFKKLTNQSYLEDLESLREDFIPDHIKLEVLKELLDIYFNANLEHKIIDLIDEIKKLDVRQTYIPNYFESLYKLNYLDQLASLAEQYKKHHTYAIDAYLALLRIAIVNKNYRQATILDADYETILENASDYYKIKIYPLLINLYQELNNKFNLELFTKKLKQINKQEKNNKKEVTDVKQVINHDQKNNHFEPLQIKPKSNVIKNFNALIDLINYSHQISETKNFRDVLRAFFIKLEEYITCKDLILFRTKDEYIFNYKKERLYDKQLIKASYQDTIIGEIIKDGEERFGTLDTLTFDKNVLTLSKYTDEVKYYFAYPIYDVGVFLVHMDQAVDDPGNYYDFLKGISSILYTLLVDDEKRVSLREDNQFLSKIIDSNLLAFRMLSKGFSTYNITAQKLLHVDSHMPYEIFIRNLGVHEVRSYEMMIERLFSKPNLVDAVTYLYGQKQIRERLVSIQDKNEIKIVSTFEDLSNYYEERSKLVMEATVDFETSLPNMNALNERLPELIKEKGSFILLSFNDSILPIYGYDVAIRFFKEFGQVTKKFFSDGEVYRFSTYQLFLYIPINDIRSVTKAVKDYLRHVDNYESLVITYEKFNPKLSIIRYPVVTEEKNPAKLFRYLELSLDYLKRLSADEPYIFFEHKIYEDEVFEQQVINYLNEAMNKNQLALSFSQIIDIERNIVWHYESELILQNMDIDPKYLLAIAKKRNRLNDLEKYHVLMVCQFLSTLEKETQKLVKITIPVSKETFTDMSFNPYVFGLFQKYEIPFEFIRFRIKGDNLKSREHTALINELTNVGIGMDTTSVDVALNYPFNAVHLDFKKQDPKWNDYMNLLNSMLANHQMALVIRDVKTKEQKELLQSLNIKYIEGPIYKKITADQLFYKIAGN